jgi:hypothetical protein
MTRALVLLISAIPAWAQCDSLLSWEEYRAARVSLPYVLRIPAPRGELLMFGAKHTMDPRDPQISEIERLWGEFEPDISFSEGGVRPPAHSRDEAVGRYGEPGLVRFLADREHVRVQSLEPPEDKEAAEIARQVPREQVKLFYFLRYISDYRRSPNARSIEDYAEDGLKLVRSRRKLSGAPDSVKEVQALCARLLPELKDWRAVPASWFDPTKKETFLNDIARRSTEVRNCHMAPLIAGAVRSGKRVFVVVGGSHAIVQERALRSACSR